MSDYIVTFQSSLQTHMAEKQTGSYIGSIRSTKTRTPCNHTLARGSLLPAARSYHPARKKNLTISAVSPILDTALKIMLKGLIMMLAKQGLPPTHYLYHKPGRMTMAFPMPLLAWGKSSALRGHLL